MNLDKKSCNNVRSKEVENIVNKMNEETKKKMRKFD